LFGLVGLRKAINFRNEGLNLLLGLGASLKRVVQKMSRIGRKGERPILRSLSGS